MKKININFIPQNIAPVGAKEIAIFDSNDNKVDSIHLGNLTPKNLGTKLYSFGALSDVHLPYAAQNASSDFQKALTYFNNVANVNFICISGDISDAGTEAEWLDYKNHVDTYSPNTPVYMCTGNHDTANDITYEYPIQYTGNPLWYSFTQGDDVFIFFGLRQWQGDNVFYNEALQWLYETLEENKDKRCFVFQHEMRLDGCGNAHGLYGWDGLSGKNGQVFLSLMEHYKNVIWFHGHSHTPFRLQSTQPTPIANYDRLHGCHSVHIPSLAVPRYGNSDVIFDAEGYIVDVYENGIHLRGIDFIEEEFVPIASYWIDTTPVDIPVDSYTDKTGTIKPKAISLPEDSELALNQRYSYSGKGIVDDAGMFVTLIPVKNMTGSCTVKIKNSSIAINSASSSVIYALDSNKTSLAYINGGNIPNMTEGITYSEDYKSADITFTLPNGCAYIALSLRVASGASISAKDIKDYIIEIEGEVLPEEVLPEEVLKYTNLVPISINSDGSIYNSVGYKNNSYVSTDGTVKDNTGTVATGYIKTNSNVFYIFGAEFALSTYSRLKLYDENFNTLSTQIIADDTGKYETEDIGNGITKLTFNIGNSHEYIRFNLYGTGENLYIYTMNNENEISLPEGSELYINQRYSHSEVNLVTANGMFAVLIPVDNMTGSCTVKIKNSTIPLNVRQDPNSVIYALDSNKLSPTLINGGHISDMTEGITYSKDFKSADITFTLPDDCAYIALSLSVASGTSISAKDIKDYIIEIEGETILAQGNITNIVTWTMDKRLSSVGDPDKDSEGTMASDFIAVNPGDVINIYGITSLSARAFMINLYKDEVLVNCIPLSNADMNPTDNNYAYAEYDAVTLHLTIQIKDGQPINSIRVCCVTSSVTVYRNAERVLGPIVLPEGSELHLNQRFSQSGKGLQDANGNFAIFIPIDGTKAYTLSISGMPTQVFNTNGTVTIYKLEETKTNATTFNGSNFPKDMTTGATISEDYKSAIIDIPAGDATTHYLVFTATLTSSSVELTEESLAGIVINLETQLLDGPVLPEGSELLIGQRYSQSGGTYVADAEGKRMFVLTIPVERNTDYLLTCKNLNIPFTIGGSTFYLLDSNKAYVGIVNGGNNFSGMTSGVTILDDGKGAEVEFVTSFTTKYIVVSVLATTATAITVDDIKDYIITLEKIEIEISEPKEITSNVTWTADTRLSSNDGNYKTQAGTHASNDILVKRGDIIRIYGATLWSLYAYIGTYNNDSGLLQVLDTNEYTHSEYIVTSKDVNNVLTIEIIHENVSYIRVCGNGIKPDNMRVSINKELNPYDFNGDYDEPHWFDIYIDSATGEMSTDDTGYATTAFLRYNKQNIYTFAVTEALVPHRVFFYDSSKAFISCTDQSNDLTCIIDYAPMGTAYFRFRGDYDNNNGSFTFNTAASNVIYNVTQRPTYNVTNLVSTSQSVDSNAVYNGVGYKDNAYISTTNKVEGSVNGYALTGLIPYTITKESAPTIYIRGVELPDSDTYPRFTLYNSEKTVVGIMHTNDLTTTYFTKETLGHNYYKFTPVRAASTGDIRLSNNATGNAYISIGGKGLGEYLIVTFDEPIENNFTDLLQTQDVQLSKRWSASSNGYVDKNGAIAFSVPFSDINGKTIKLVGFEPETNGTSTWYAYKDGAAIGRIANPASGVIWTSSELINNGDGSYDIPISTEIFKDLNRTDAPISDIPDTIYITMHVGSIAIDTVKVLLC